MRKVLVLTLVLLPIAAFAGPDTPWLDPNQVISITAPAAPSEWQKIIDFVLDNLVKPILVVVVPVIASMFIGLLVALLKKHNIELDQVKQSQFELAATKSLEWALTTMFDQIENKGPQGWTSDQIKNTAISRAKDYMLDRFPGAVSDQVGNSSLTAISDKTDPIMVRLYPKVVTELAASPASPPAPSPTAVPVVDVALKS